MKHKTIYLNKMTLDAINKIVESKGIDKKKVFIAYPDREKDLKVFNKIWNGTFKATISHIRILWKHKNFFRLIGLCAKNDALQRMISKGLIKEEVINSLLEKLKDELEVLRYILKWLFLPLDEEMLPDGNIIQKVASQDFDSLDELIFDEMANKCYDWLSDLFDVTRNEFNNW